MAPIEEDQGRVYDTARWDRARIQVFREEPWCRACLKAGIKERSREVDHIVPIAEGGAEYDRANLQALCKPCHSRKTLSENRKART